MKVMFIPNIFGTLGKVTEGLIKGVEYLEIREQVETIQTTALLRTARIPRRVLKTWGDLLSLKLLWVKANVEDKSVQVLNNNNNNNSNRIRNKKLWI